MTRIAVIHNGQLTEFGEFVIEQLRQEGCVVIVEEGIIKDGGSLLSPSRITQVDKFFDRRKEFTENCVKPYFNQFKQHGPCATHN